MVGFTRKREHSNGAATFRRLLDRSTKVFPLLFHLTSPRHASIGSGVNAGTEAASQSHFPDQQNHLGKVLQFVNDSFWL
jgi:hypothetical protein